MIPSPAFPQPHRTRPLVMYKVERRTRLGHLKTAVMKREEKNYARHLSTSPPDTPTHPPAAGWVLASVGGYMNENPRAWLRLADLSRMPSSLVVINTTTRHLVVTGSIPIWVTTKRPLLPQHHRRVARSGLAMDESK